MSTFPPLAYAQLNLTRNPFGELTDADLVMVARVHTERWREHLKDPAAILQLVGEKGRGKTTSLKVLQTYFPDCEYLHLRESGPHRVELQGPLFLDEAQRLGWWARRRLWKELRLRALATHVDYSEELRRAGRSVLTQNVPCEWNSDVLLEFVACRIERFRRSEGTLPWLEPAEAENLIQRFGDDIRNLMGHLYHCVQLQSQVGPIDVRC